MRWFLAAGGACAAMAFGPAPAWAQETEQADAPTVGEIVVTARKEKENLQNVPISITAFDSAAIEDRALRDVQDIAYSVPNLNISRLTTLSTQVSIRGISSADSAPGFETGVAVILDDVYIGRAAGFSTSLLDIERIEVLRGPQGTLQGRNVLGGSINLTTTRPSDDFFAKGRVSFGNYDELVASGVVSGPIVPGRLAAKLAVERQSRDGYARNVDLDKPLDTKDSWAGRAQIAFTPSDALTILVTGDYTHYNNHDFHNDYSAPDPVNVLPELLDRRVGGDVWNYGWREVYGAALNVYYDFGNGMRLASVSSVRGYSVVDVQEADPVTNFGVAGAGTFIATARNDQSQDQISQELRLHSAQGGAFTWLAGLYYYHEVLRNYQNFLAGFNLGTVIAGSSSIDDSRTGTDSYAAFGSFTYRFDDRFSLTGGLRYTINDRNVRVQELLGIDGTDPLLGTYVNPITLADPAPKAYLATVDLGTTRNSISDKVVSGDLTFAQQWTPDVSTYLKYARGFKGGGFNASFNSGFSGGLVKPEYIDAYEAGLRSELFNRRVRFNVTGFYMKQRDQQVLQFDEVNFRYVTRNEPGVRTFGGELELTVAVAQPLTWSFTAGLVDAKVTAGPNKGLKSPYTSPVSFTTALSFDQPVSEGVRVFAFGEASWRDRYALSATPGPLGHQEAYWWLTARAGFKAADDSWAIGLYGRNLLNETVVSSMSHVPGLFNVGFIQEPRTYGVEARFAF
ncbi:TonB-dependent receptor [Sphingomonas canadensis]|uniref:TonB-dependent receptor n=1 Tax=Sphingomonas canadensis TaxID=1219257 RepID=A0ABW3HB11_9SPHN|nr:TonB-dependent receptor [Sphingomonas canadensis]MCW3838104.1 TonB-dependent receptor [Sphingomonas canadensis]